MQTEPALRVLACYRSVYQQLASAAGTVLASLLLWLEAVPVLTGNQLLFISTLMQENILGHICISINQMFCDSFI